VLPSALVRSATLLGLAALVLISVAAAPAAGSGSTPQRISADSFPDGVPGSHATEVEPSASASGSTVVAVFQVGRIYSGGSAAIGYSTSTDGGRSWSSGLLPALTPYTTPPASATFVSDPVVAFDARHGRWLASTLAADTDRWKLLVSGSPNGTAWSAPVTALATAPQTVDKEWLTCDNWPTSPFRGHCYLAYSSWGQSSSKGQTSLAVQTSTDGGMTWGPQVLLPVEYDPRTDTLSAEPVVRPNGELVVVFVERRTVKAVRSTDGGSTFGPRATVAQLSLRSYSFQPARLRGSPIPTVAADDAGSVYAAWYDCRFRRGCTGNDIVLTRSRGPRRWTPPQRVPLPAPSSSTDFLLPALAVAPGTEGTTAHLALAYYTLSSSDCTGPSCRLAAELATSVSGGRTWRARSVGDSMALDWLAPTSIGRMVGDYVAAVFVPGQAVGVFSLAGPLQAGRFDQAIAAASAPAVDPPRNIRAPAVAGWPRVGRTLVCRRGSWTGPPPIRYAYRWLRGGRGIPGSNTPRYRVRSRDTGTRLACRVRATNSGGATQATSPPVRVVPR
jgi:hypothetical protein